MPFLSNIWNVLTLKRPGGGGFPNIPITTLGGTKLYAMLATGQIPVADTLEKSVGLSRTFKI